MTKLPRKKRTKLVVLGEVGECLAGADQLLGQFALDGDLLRLREAVSKAQCEFERAFRDEMSTDLARSCSVVRDSRKTAAP